MEKMKNNIVYLADYAPWKNVLIPSKAQFVVYPSARGGYSAQGVPLRFAHSGQRLHEPAPSVRQPGYICSALFFTVSVMAL